MHKGEKVSMVKLIESRELNKQSLFGRLLCILEPLLKLSGVRDTDFDVS